MKAALGLVAAVALLAVGCSNDAGGHGAAASPTTATSTPAGAGDGSAAGSGDGSETGSGAAPGGTASAVPEPGAQSVSTPVPAGSARCHTAELTASVRFLGAAAGNRYAALVLTNHTTRTCRIYGYGGLGLLDAHHHPVPSRQVRDATHPPRLLTVRPGQSVSALLHWGVVPSTGDAEQGPCQPEAAFLSVIPPDETAAILVDWTGGPVCQQGRIEQWAYQPGIVNP